VTSNEALALAAEYNATEASVEESSILLMDLYRVKRRWKERE
jgi:hypothetical protein